MAIVRRSAKDRAPSSQKIRTLFFWKSVEIIEPMQTPRSPDIVIDVLASEGIMLVGIVAHSLDVLNVDAGRGIMFWRNGEQKVNLCKLHRPERGPQPVRVMFGKLFANRKI